MKTSDIEKFIADEKEAIEGYTKMSRSVKSAIVSKMFHDIAVDEMKHLEALEDLLDKMGCLAEEES